MTRPLAVLLLLAAFCSGAYAQTFPTKTVRFVVPHPPGGGTDIMGRILARKLSEMWGQPVIVDNRGGGNTVIGTDMVAKAAPDGHTLLVTPAPFAIVPSLIPKLPYDPQKDFQPVSLINTTPLALVVHPGVPAASVKELIKLAAARPGALNYGSSGSGGSNHLAGELFNTMAKVKMVHVPYKGNVAALTDLLGGHLDLAFNGVTGSLPYIKAGKLRALGVTSLKRSGVLPHVPTLDEQGLKGFQAVGWNGLTAPAGTPKEVVAKINADVQKVIRSPELTEQLKAQGSDPVAGSVSQYEAFLREEIAKWNKVIRFAGIKEL